MPRRVRRPKEKEKIFKDLTEGENKVFETYKDVFMMAACIGYNMGRREVFDTSSEPIAWSVFNGQTDLPIINAIALNTSEDVAILLDDEDTFDRKLKIVEEYANAGLDVLKERVLESPGNSLENLINIINENKKSPDDINDLQQFEGTLF